MTLRTTQSSDVASQWLTISTVLHRPSTLPTMSISWLYSEHWQWGSLREYRSLPVSPLTVGLVCNVFVSPLEQLLELHRGQGKDIYWRDGYICPTEEEYMMMVKQSKS